MGQDSHLGHAQNLNATPDRSRSVSTPVVERPVPVPAPSTRDTVRQRVRSGVGSGWLPTALLVAVTALVLRFYEVPLPTTAAFGAYLALGIVLPGTLVWRALHRGPGWFPAEVAAGTAVGYAGEVFAYLPARAIGQPLLVLAWPIGVVAAFLAVPRLRRHWRSRSAERTPTRWAWPIAVCVAATVVWSCRFYKVYGLKWPFNSAPDTDSPFHLALLGEAKHHVPPATPWVSGEPLFYHWFVYAEMAATSWVTGIEPQVLLLRLAMLPMLAGFVVLVAALARTLFGTWWTGVAAVVGTLFVLAPNPYGWPLADFYTNLGFSPVDDGSALRLTVWTGPTQTFGALLFAAVALVLVDLLRTASWRKRRWLLFTVLVAAVMGAKATYLPLLLAGLLLVVAAAAVFRRRLDTPALTGAGITLVCLVFAQVVLFGGRTQGLRWQPLLDVKTAGIGTTGYLAGDRTSAVLVVAGIAIGCWSCVWAGVSGLFGPAGRARMTAPVVLLLGIGAAGMTATMLFGQSGDSQRFFLESARPYLALAAVGGLAAALPRVGRRTVFALLLAMLAGTVTVYVVRRLDGPTIPHTGRGVVWPYAALAIVALVASAALFLVRRKVLIAHALVIALLAGFGLATSVSNFAHIVHDGRSTGWRHTEPVEPIVTEGTPEAGRWLRNHSDPDDLVATNAHCLPWPGEYCTNLHFSVTAYSERRVLLEGWGFTGTAHDQAAAQHLWVGYVPYWKPEVLAANDAVFATPTSGTVSALRDTYHVKWIFVDETVSRPAFGLLATLRFHSGYCAVYELPTSG
jgi:hypothetical protein